MLSVNSQYMVYVHDWTHKMRWAILTTFSTYIVGLIKDNNWGLLQFFGHKVSNFRIQKVMITVHNYVSMVNLTKEAGEIALASQNSKREFFIISFMSQFDILLPKVQHVGQKLKVMITDG